MGNFELRTKNEGKEGPKEDGAEVGTTERQKLVHDYEEILDIIGFGRAQMKMLFLSFTVLLMIMNELMGIGVITIASQCDFNLDDADKGLMHGILLWGKIASSYFLGYLSDKLGRRKVLAYANFAGAFFSFLTMFTTNYTVFIVFRFCVGFFTSGAVGIVLAYIAEFSSAAHRPVLMNFSSISNAVSFIYVPVIAWLILLMDWKIVLFENFVFRPWRLLIFFNLLPGFISSVIVLRYPESPKFLLALGKRKEAYDALDWVCQQNRKGLKLSELQIYEVKNLNEEDFSVERNEKGGFIEAVCIMCVESLALFKRPHVLNFIVSSLTMSASFVISFGLAVWYPDIQNSIGHSNKESQAVCSIILDVHKSNATDMYCNDHVSNKSLIDFLIYGVMSVVAYTILGAIINRQRRKALLIFLLIAAGTCGIALIWLENSIAIVVAFSLYIVFADLAVSTILGFLVDLFPTTLCGQGSCLVMTVARISGAVSTYIIGLELSTHCVVVFEIFAAMTFMCAVLSYFLKPLNKSKSQDAVP